MVVGIMGSQTIRMRGAAIHPTPWARTAAGPDVLLDAHQRVRDLRAQLAIGGRTASGPWHADVTSRDRSVRVWDRDIRAAIQRALDAYEAGVATTGVTWRAGSDGVAHAHKGRVTACHAAAVPESYARPESATCARCLRALAQDRAA